MPADSFSGRVKSLVLRHGKPRNRNHKLQKILFFLEEIKIIISFPPFFFTLHILLLRERKYIITVVIIFGCPLEIIAGAERGGGDAKKEMKLRRESLDIFSP